MRKFVLGFAVAVLVVLTAGFCYVRFGFVDPRADLSVGWLESKVAMPALDAAVDRRAPETKNPLHPTDANLSAGMKIYQPNCASCHGDIQHPHAQLADALYPRAPQFAEDAPDMPENQNFYIIQHGIRLSGIPAWKQALSEQEIWQLTTFLSHMDKLPPQVSAAWTTTSVVSQNTDSSYDGLNMEMKDKKSTGLPRH
ncbi:c-type cytochrome [Tunturiibacter lichenicola]|uniref:c-type cytochrome n=1 Tax=Tunturiibacter lichenicola TaxID=2051959 RepID=UPI0021B3253C|nr:c-type cytochrome [Edaphobacter lichenicola]